MEPPPGWGKDDLSSFIDEAGKNTFATFVRGPESFDWLVDIDSTFRKAASYLNKLKDMLVPMFLLRSHSCFLAGVRLALSTQVYEVNPVIRSGLEAALYGLLVAKKPDLQRVWLDRNQSPESLTVMKQEFTIGACFRLLETEDPRRHEAFRGLYGRTIDFGAHPNPLGVLSNVEFRSDEDGVHISTHYLTDDKDRIKYALKVTAEVGVAALWIFRLAIPERFEIMGLDEKIEELAQGL